MLPLDLRYLTRQSVIAGWLVCWGPNFDPICTYFPTTRNFADSVCKICGTGLVHSESVPNVRRLVNFERGSFGYLCPELLGEFRNVVGEYRCFVACAGDGNVSETRTQQVGMDAGVCVDEDALGSESLGTMTCNCIAVIEVAVFPRIELDATAIVGSGGNEAV